MFSDNNLWGYPGNIRIANRGLNYSIHKTTNQMMLIHHLHPQKLSLLLVFPTISKSKLNLKLKFLRLCFSLHNFYCLLIAKEEWKEAIKICESIDFHNHISYKSSRKRWNDYLHTFLLFYATTWELFDAETIVLKCVCLAESEEMLLKDGQRMDWVSSCCSNFLLSSDLIAKLNCCSSKIKPLKILVIGKAEA